MLRLDCGEKIVEEITKLVTKENIKLASIDGLGAGDQIVFGLYSVEKREFLKTEVNEDFEISSIVGNVTQKDGSRFGRTGSVPYPVFYEINPENKGNF